MRFVSPFLKRVVYPCLAKSGYFKRTARQGLCAITYHGVMPDSYRARDPAMDGALVRAGNFRDQLRLLKSRYHVITPGEMLEWAENRARLPKQAVLLTCDDGLLNNLTDMLPILQEENLRCIFFVTGASAGEVATTLWYEELYLILLAACERKFVSSVDNVILRACSEKNGKKRRAAWWDIVKELSQVNSEDRNTLMAEARASLGLEEIVTSTIKNDPILQKRLLLLTSPQVKQLIDGGMTIGAHTLTHPVLSKLSEDCAFREMADSRRLLEEVFSIPVWAVAYPFGDHEAVGERECEMAQKAGYKCAFVNVDGGFGEVKSHFAIPRVHVTAEMSLSEFEAHVTGFYNRLKRPAQ